MQQYIEKAKKNEELWQNYKETESDLQVYKKKDVSESDVSKQVEKFER